MKEAKGEQRRKGVCLYMLTCLQRRQPQTSAICWKWPATSSASQTKHVLWTRPSAWYTLWTLRSS